jgi:hypothetical protein
VTSSTNTPSVAPRLVAAPASWSAPRLHLHHASAAAPPCPTFPLPPKVSISCFIVLAATVRQTGHGLVAADPIDWLQTKGAAL